MQVSSPDEVRKPLHAGGRSPYLLWLLCVVWVPFIVPVIIELFVSHVTLLGLIVSLVGVALFFGIYLWTSWRRAQQLVAASLPPGNVATWLPIIVLAALSFVLALVNGKDWLLLFYFICGYAGVRLPTVRALQGMVALVLLIVAVGLLIHASWLVIGQAALFVCVIGSISITITRSINTSWELHAAREEIARLAVTTERLRIARDLHDLLGHTLSLIALKSELAGRLVRLAPERAVVEIGDVEQVARTTLQEVREAVASYRQPTLLNELHSAQEILAAAGIAYRYEGDVHSSETLPTAIEGVLAWTVREGVTNIIRHSHAHQCTIRVTRDRHDIHVEVIDDGAGVPAETAAQPKAGTSGTGNGGHGLHGLVERVDALGGRFEAGPRAGGGFHLAVSVPLVRGEQS